MDHMDNTKQEMMLNLTRRQLLGRGFGSIALASVLGDSLSAAPSGKRIGGLPALPHFAAKAKRVIYLFQSGAPSQYELFDHKPELEKRHGDKLTPDFFKGQRQTGMTSRKEKRVCRSIYKFKKHGKSGIQLGELLPHLGKVADELCLVRSVQTQAINHDPAITFFQTGFQQAGRPSIGAWLSYGLGSENSDLPAYVVMISQGSAKRDSQALYDRLWGSGFLPSAHQGVKFRSSGDPVLYLSNPPGISAERRRRLLDLSKDLNERRLVETGDPETATRIKQAELAFRMQTSVPELMDTSKESKHVMDLYGPNAGKPGTYAANCLLARRLAERGVRFIQLYHRGWDTHGDLPRDLPLQCGDVDQPSAALIADLKQRGMLDETLIIFGGEFGRTIYAQGKLDMKRYGRDHHPRCFSIWMAGGGIKPGLTYGTTDEFGFDIVENPVHVYDLHATMLHCLGVDHEKLTYKFQGRHYRLTDVHGRVIKDLLA